MNSQAKYLHRLEQKAMINVGQHRGHQVPVLPEAADIVVAENENELFAHALFQPPDHQIEILEFLRSALQNTFKSQTRIGCVDQSFLYLLCEISRVDDQIHRKKLLDMLWLHQIVGVGEMQNLNGLHGQWLWNSNV